MHTTARMFSLRASAQVACAQHESIARRERVKDEAESYPTHLFPLTAARWLLTWHLSRGEHTSEGSGAPSLSPRAAAAL